MRQPYFRFNLLPDVLLSYIYFLKGWGDLMDPVFGIKKSLDLTGGMDESQSGQIEWTYL